MSSNPSNIVPEVPPTEIGSSASIGTDVESGNFMMEDSVESNSSLNQESGNADPNDVMPPPPKIEHFEGWLYKQSDYLKIWRKRYFRIDSASDPTLYYWLSDKDASGKPRGEISLEDATVATAEQHTDRPFCFAVFHPSRRTYFLSAPTEEDMLNWLEAFQVSAGVDEQVGPDDFELLTVVGRGKFAKVFQVRHKKTKKIYAMKVIRKEVVFQKKQIKGTKTERLVLQQIRHPFCVSLRFAFQTGDKLYLITDFINGGELFQYIQKERRFSENRARLYAAEIVLALEYLHKMDIIHRDLKPENILMDMDGHIKITDFGLSKQAKSASDPTYTFCGTAAYMAPEILLQKGHNKSVDWWTVGILVAEMLTGLPPFYSQNKQEMFRRILKERLHLPDYLSEEAKDLLYGLLQREPWERFGSGPSDAEEIKSHPWFLPINWDDVLAKSIDMPVKPKLRSLEDTSSIDPVFTTEAPVDSPPTTPRGNTDPNTNDKQSQPQPQPSTSNANSNQPSQPSSSGSGGEMGKGKSGNVNIIDHRNGNGGRGKGSGNVQGEGQNGAHGNKNKGASGNGKGKGDENLERVARDAKEGKGKPSQNEGDDTTDEVFRGFSYVSKYA